MDANFKYRKAFLIVAYGVLLQLLIRPYIEINSLEDAQFRQYLISKGLILAFYVFSILCLHTKRLAKYWVAFFYIGCFSYTLIGQYFNPGYHYSVMQFMFVTAIIFEGFPFMATLLMILYLIGHGVHSFSNSIIPAYQFFHADVYNALISSWIVCVALERYVNRMKSKKGFLDRKLRYKGIKTDLFLHDLKNNLQPLISIYPKQEDFRKIVKTIQGFNSFNEEEMLFSDVVVMTKKKCNINGTVTCTGSDDFFIDQLDLQTILSNLMNNSDKAAKSKGINLEMHIKNKYSGFVYEDNAGGMTDEQYKFFSQKDLKPYVGHEKNGLGLLLIKKLVEHQEGKFSIKKIPNGTRFEISY
jgi:translation initiation factor 1 (eIF-1/SUI1)